MRPIMEALSLLRHANWATEIIKTTTIHVFYLLIFLWGAMLILLKIRGLSPCFIIYKKACCVTTIIKNYPPKVTSQP